MKSLIIFLLLALPVLAALGTTYTATTLTVRQTVNSLNAGTIAVYAELLFLP